MKATNQMTSWSNFTAGLSLSVIYVDASVTVIVKLLFLSLGFKSVIFLFVVSSHVHMDSLLQIKTCRSVELKKNSQVSGRVIIDEVGHVDALAPIICTARLFLSLSVLL